MGDREAPGAQALDRSVRLRVFARLAETGRAPSPADLASALGVAQPGVEDALRRLAEARLLVLAPATANVWLAPPFAAVPSDFRVEARGRTYWATCAWDALGVPAALGADATIAARCADSGADLALEVRGGALVRGEGVVHFAVPAARWWENLAFA